MKVLIYTAIFGAYDKLWDQCECPDADYICFTDQPISNASLWQIKTVGSSYAHPRMAAKEFKCHPHRFIPGGIYSHAIWIDGSVSVVNADFTAVFLNALSKWGIGMITHPFRDCIYEEAKESHPMAKYRNERVMEQALHYKAHGYPAHHGMPACTVMAWDLSRPALEKIGADWFCENLLWTYQDQISLPYVLWKNKYWYDPVPLALGNETHFLINDHIDNEK